MRISALVLALAAAVVSLWVALGWISREGETWRVDRTLYTSGQFETQLAWKKLAPYFLLAAAPLAALAGFLILRGHGKEAAVLLFLSACGPAFLMLIWLVLTPETGVSLARFQTPGVPGLLLCVAGFLAIFSSAGGSDEPADGAGEGEDVLETADADEDILETYDEEEA